MESMSLRGKIGQMMMVGFQGTTVPPEFERFLRDYQVGNVILFSRNIQNARQTRALCDDLQRIVREATGHPAIISVDQEGGMVSRMCPDGTNIPGAMAEAASGDPQNAYEAGLLTGRELRALGIRLNLAPVMDVNSNPDNSLIGVRSFGETSEIVAEYGVQMMKGLQAGGVLTTLKHFPGHGDTVVDSHLGLPSVSRTAEQLAEKELVPFKTAIDAGADFIMTAHILFPNIEPKRVPAPLSHRILTGILREQLGFRGVILTDCLEMNAIKNFYGTANGALAAFQAGADMVCISHHFDLAEQAAELVEAAVKDGRLDEAVLDRAVARIRPYRERVNAGEDPTLDVVGCDAHRRTAARVSRQSVTLVRAGRGGSVVAGETAFVGPYGVSTTQVSDDVSKEFSFPGEMAKRLGGRAVYIGQNPDESEIDRVARQVKDCRTVVVGTYNGHIFRGQIALANRLCREHDHVIAVALRNPYDLGFIDQSAAAVAVYEYTPLAFAALAPVLGGQAQAPGRLPVTVADRTGF